ncbi:glycosyltransferase family protein [Carboxylicivirga linearis]|uniref:Glycosyltransferase n=1 Tax=Carboxylicivirga linearis TaxID=1628157 RepID=A0ABS5JUI9_9BACT|nr:hypothetical protein [Carboxylicivirga linearis]MBS2098539.1 hypothetical protein [Carboxylicivirga linearis]
MKKKNLLFLTTSNLPTNPRLLKEVDLALKEHIVSVVLFNLGNWSEALNQKEMNKRPSVNFIQLSATRSQAFSWLFWALMEKLGRFLYPLFKRCLFVNALVHTRRSVQLWYTLRKIKHCDLLIGHNLGTLYPIYQLSLSTNIPFIYDIEDYDPGIHVPEAGKHYKSCTEYLLKKCAPKAKALTSASPLIGDYTLKLIGGHPNHQVILNSFPQKEFVEPKNSTLNSQLSTLKLVWFSQNISFGRGLEQFFEAILLLSKEADRNWNIEHSNIQLTLIGNLDPQFDQQIIQPFLSSIVLVKKDESQIANRKSHIINLNIQHPMSQPDLHTELTKHDIGLALEFDTTDLNRQLCLTNKIMAYAQAGHFILATDTLAQSQFLSHQKELGLLCGQSTDEIAMLIKHLTHILSDIQHNRRNRLNIGKSLSWEIEKVKIVNLWNNFI